MIGFSSASDQNATFGDLMILFCIKRKYQAIQEERAKKKGGFGWEEWKKKKVPVTLDPLWILADNEEDAFQKAKYMFSDWSNKLSSHDQEPELVVTSELPHEFILSNECQADSK